MAVTIGRKAWGARHEDGGGDAPLPVRQWWLHHSYTLAPDLEWVDADGDHVDDDEQRAMRTLEDIGETRFHRGISYTWPIMPSGRIYVGHSVDRLGAHTAGRNSIGRAICFVGDYENHKPTDAQLTAAAQLMVDEHRAGRATTHRLNGGHRDLKPTACPGKHAYAAIGEINRRAEVLWNDPTAAPTAAATDRRGDDPVHNHPVTGTGQLRLICPTGKSSSIVGRAWISAVVNGVRPGNARVFFQSDTAGISDVAWDIAFTHGRSQRVWKEVPDGTTQINVQYQFPNGGVICLETEPKR